MVELVFETDLIGGFCKITQFLRGWCSSFLYIFLCHEYLFLSIKGPSFVMVILNQALTVPKFTNDFSTKYVID